MPSPDAIALDDSTFDVIFGMDPVYAGDCGQLCGDAHFCHFERCREFTGLKERDMQETPLLAGEHDPTGETR